MRRVLVDTSAYAAFKRGDANLLDIFRRVDVIGLSVVVLGELLGGFAVGSKEHRNRTELDAFLRSPRVTLLPLDDDTAAHYARVYKTLRTKGRPIPTNDLWIAATALQHGYTLCTLDAHFAVVDNLMTCTCPAELFP